MLERSPSRALVLALLGLLTLGGLALPASSAAAASTAAPSAPGQAWVRVGHFVPGMGATTVDLEPRDGSGGPVSMGSAAYGDVSSYEKLAPGVYTVTVTETSAATGSAPLLSRSLKVTADGARTLAVVGTSAAPRLAILADDLTTPAPGTARVRLLSASQEAGDVSVRAVGGPVVAEGAVLGQATSYRTVPAGSWTLALEGDSASATLERVPVASGSVYTVVALDAPSGGVELQVVTDAAGAVVAPRGGARTGRAPAATWLDRVLATLRAEVTAAPSPEIVSPVSISVPAIGVAASMVDLGIADDGTIEVPSDPDQVGWLDTTPVPGDQGPAVVAGHVDSTSGPAVFARLASLRQGDEVLVTRHDGTTARFTVDGVRRFPQDRFPTAAVYGPVPGPALRLITCGGDYRADDGGYQDNVVVFAS